MPRYLVVEDDTVTNIVEFDPDMPSKHGWIAAPDDEVAIGWKQQKDGTFVEASSSDTVPRQVTMLGVRRALRGMGILQVVDDYVQKNGDDDTKDWWRLGVVIERSDPALARTAELASLTDEAVDAVFVMAAKLG